MSPLTPRELRILADHVERLTKARVVNAQLGVDTLPDTVEVDFPNGFTGTVHWTPRRTWNSNAEQAVVARHGRHRDCYQLDVATITVTILSATTATTKAGAKTRFRLSEGASKAEAAQIINSVAARAGRA